jgi:hypothetical protein
MIMAETPVVVVAAILMIARRRSQKRDERLFDDVDAV